MCRSDPACRQHNLEGTREILPARVDFMGPSFGGKTAGGVTGVGLGLSVKIDLGEMSTSLFSSMVKGVTFYISVECDCHADFFPFDMRCGMTKGGLRQTTFKDTLLKSN
ncbi:hypothetical protein RRG08_051484 [Elysia crispata]|uniref:Uncharacterized protein n=1 Tax=Elysia crispata TaxID=231223 RepID=A0AAE0ZV40_9GAST|nr:hypothetical protein RRG08_051484 [Elysia crispata]